MLAASTFPHQRDVWWELGLSLLPRSLKLLLVRVVSQHRFTPRNPFEVPNGYSLPYVVAGHVSGGLRGINPYANAVQSTNLRSIETQIDPRYQAKNDTVELECRLRHRTYNSTFTSSTGYNQDFLWSTEDYNRFNTTPDMFSVTTNGGTRLNSPSLSLMGISHALMEQLVRRAPRTARRILLRSTARLQSLA